MDRVCDRSQERELNVTVAVIMGTMIAGRGVGCIKGGPVTEGLLSLPRRDAQGAYGTRFEWLILFTGVSSLLGRVGLFGGWIADAQEKPKVCGDSVSGW